jgi:Uma2 family endonuclease
MASLPHPKRVTYEEWLQMPEVDDAIEEVIDGEIILMPPNKAVHALIADFISDELKRQLDRSQYLILTTNFGLIISERPLTCRVPDVAVLDRALPKDGYFRFAHIAVEVLSPSETRRTIERKLQDYETIATPEVWVINPQDRAVEVFLLQNGILERSAILTDGILKPRAFPHVEIDIAQIWPA